MNTRFDTLEYQDTLRRRSASAERTKVVALYVIGSAVFVFQLFRVASDFHFHWPARAAVVHVGGDGTFHVDGCSNDVTTCLAQARGHGSSRCRIEANASAPESAKAAAKRACVAANLDPRLAIVKD